MFNVEKSTRHTGADPGGDSELANVESQHSEQTQRANRPRLRILVPGEDVDGEATNVKESSACITGGTSFAGPHSITPPAPAMKANSPVFNQQLPMRSGKASGSWARKLARLLGIPKSTWITDNFDATHIKPVIRAVVAAWISVVFLVTGPVERLMGQAGFLVIIATFFSPPAEAFIQVLERELMNLVLASSSFAWACLGIRLANLARKEINPFASSSDIFSGRYIEAWPTVICAIFLFIWTSFLLYTRARAGPGSYTIAVVLSCIVTDFSLTVGHLFPYPYYEAGESVIIPIACHSAIAIVCSAVVFPESVNAQFIERFRDLFLVLSSAMRTQPLIFAKSALSDEFDPSPFFKEVEGADSALAPLAATSRLMKRDISWGRFCSNDFSRLHELLRLMTLRANGMAFYFRIMDSSANRQPGTCGFSLLNTPMSTPRSSRPPSPSRYAQSSRSLNDSNAHSGASDPSTVDSALSGASTERNKRKHRHSVHNSLYHHTLRFSHHRHSSALPRLHHQHRNYQYYGHNHDHHHRYPRHHHGRLAPSPFHDVVGRSEGKVGVFESQRYLNLEAELSHPNPGQVIPQIVRQLGESSEDLTHCVADALDHLARKFRRMNEDRFYKLFCREREMTWEEGIRNDERMAQRLRGVLREFRSTKRHLVLDLYRPHVEPSSQPSEEPPPHRYLFQCYMYQYHLMFFTEHLCQTFDDLIDLEKTRPRSKLWFPILPFKQIIMRSSWEPTDVGMQNNEDEDPDIIQGIDPEKTQLLGQVKRRDPDALPPSNMVEAIGTAIYSSVSALARGNAVFGFKAGILSVLLSLPNFIPSSAMFAYANRSMWALVIGQMTLSRFRGDTISGWVGRVKATFFGGIIGTIMWYVSTGLGDGNPYGLAVVCAITFPFLFFTRLYFPAAFMTVTIFVVTVGLVIGYSWQDARIFTTDLLNAGKGIEVAWKRFLLVTTGVSVAFIFSYFPPSTTLRRYLRTTYATTALQLGQAYCDVVSNVTVRGGAETEVIVKELIAIRLKLRRSKSLMENVVYELSLRGRWPRDRYEAICEIQLEIAYLLSHLRSVTEHLEPSWARAFLKRTRFLEPEFQGDVLAVISMISTSLRTGTPLPQVTPCPLLDRFVAPKFGLQIVKGDADGSSLSENGCSEIVEDDVEGTDVYGEDSEYAGLPRRLTARTLEDEQYLYFSVGVATVFGIVTRLDRLMVATKELVGEQFHITGLPLYAPSGGLRGPPKKSGK